LFRSAIFIGRYLKFSDVSHTALIFIFVGKNETKEKGDVGVAMVIADLTKRGYKIANPLSEHLPFDLIVISPCYKLSRVSVKFSGHAVTCKINLRTVSTNSTGHVVKYLDMDCVDGFAVYSPVTDECYYLHKSQIGNRKNVVGIRIKDTKCSNLEQILFAVDFKNPEVLFKADCRNGNGPDLKSEASNQP
jgi:hypothetical protein